MSSIEKITELISAAKDITNGISGYDCKCKESRVDKFGLGFNLDDRFSAHKGVLIRVDSWTGVYGDSGCGSSVRINNNDVFAKHFLKIMNIKFRELMALTAESIIEEAIKYKEAAIKELENQKQTLETL